MRYSRTQLEELWVAAKRGRTYVRLKNPCEVDYEFKGQFGHPSSYAYVKLECVPADDISFESVAEWPSGVALEESAYFAQAVAEAVVEALLAGIYSHSGCSVRLVAVRYDAIGSSYTAYAHAANRALALLLQQEWAFAPRVGA